MPVSAVYAQAKTEVERLVERFARLSARNRKRTSGAATRHEFVLPLFRALGWNVEDAREVSPEERISRGCIDFAFRLSGIPRFFLGTGPHDLRWAERAINYAWLKGVTWAVLADFERLQVFNAEWQETIPARALFKDLYWREYLDRFDDLWLLSRPAVAVGMLDRAAEAVGWQATRTPASRRLLADLTAWRRELFHHLQSPHAMWSAAQIDEAVQLILERLIFIRTCEDRGIEEPRLLPLLGHLRDGGCNKDLLNRLNSLYREFERVYDGRLFAPHFCEELISEAAPYERIIEGLYQVPGGCGQYDFNAIDADVLGMAYEQFLGHPMRDPGDPQAVDKRATRKAQGIYYTPQPLVRYIVAQTLGRLLQGCDYEQSRQVKVLDMACGSGSFLTEAFDVLDRYLAEGRPLDPGRERTIPRMEILAGNLYGVDLDSRAVEIARLNLRLRAATRPGWLPRLDNIRQGNSLIGGRPAELEVVFGPTWRDRHPFNWEEEFPHVFAGAADRSSVEAGGRLPLQGGFHVIVGNPPYLSFGLRGAKRAEQALDRYLRDRYPDSAQYKLSIYAVFINQGVRLLSEGGYLGFIVPDSFLLGRYFSKLRRYILDTCAIQEIVLFAGDSWHGGTVGLPVILLLQKVGDKAYRAANRVTVKLCQSPDKMGKGEFEKVHSYQQSYFEGIAFNRFRLFFDDASKSFVEKIESRSVEAGQLVSVHTGVRSKIGQKNVVSARREGPTWRKGLISGGEVNRYRLDYAGHYINIDPALLWAGGWDREVVEKDKLLMRQTGDSLIAAFDDSGYYHLNNLHAIVSKGGPGYALKYILAILNSRLLNHYYHLVSLERRRAMAQTDIETIEKLPIRCINFDDPADAAHHHRLVALVEEMLHLQKECAGADEASRRDLARQIEWLDAQIDTSVCEIYGLTEEETLIL